MLEHLHDFFLRRLERIARSAGILHRKQECVGHNERIAAAELANMQAGLIQTASAHQINERNIIDMRSQIHLPFSFASLVTT